ncbi:hypothetical protein DUE52_23470 [Larkinella punicea]|uniref:Uncharacterized protein n=2 Tax=Larkinella punicea TaxID=2315727 RepID=A0A368JH74_9BACT|nr:hypothetical protein DUE52_23470 [Larkinella punicea]
MYSSVQTAQNLSDVLNEFRQSGETSILTRLDLAAYTGGSVLDILSALSDVVSPVTGLLDDALARQAYALAVERVVSVGTVDLDNLTVAEINEIVAIFIEESLVCRVINDIGSSLTTEEHDPATCVTIIDDLYQIISGAVHSDIIAELSDTNPQLPDDVNVRMESIYQLALTVLEK